VSLTDALLEHAGRAVDNNAEAWLAKGLSSARSAIEKRQAELDADTTEQTSFTEAERVLLELAPIGLDAVERRSPALVRWGRGKAAAVLIRLSSGDDQKARLHALALGMTLEAYLIASQNLTQRTANVTEQRERDADEVLSLVKEVGLGALRAAIPFLLAAI